MLSLSITSHRAPADSLVKAILSRVDFWKDTDQPYFRIRVLKSTTFTVTVKYSKTLTLLTCGNHLLEQKHITFLEVRNLIRNNDWMYIISSNDVPWMARHTKLSISKKLPA